jgi:CMP-N,N'-diacetyllegionaminic acid synthase
MKILAVIPARGGSKRVPGKNVRKLGNKPLINWTIESALNTPELSAIVVSTDDPQIAEIAKSAGAIVPWLRPIKLATDESKSVNVAIHALDWFEMEYGKVDGILLLQPTSPFRTCETIQKAIRLFKNHKGSSIIGVSPVQNHYLYTLEKYGEFLVQYRQQRFLRKKTHDKSQIYALNGSIYLVSPQELRSSNSFLGSYLLPVIVESPIEALDIDTEDDFKIAEIFLSHRPSLDQNN